MKWRLLAHVVARKGWTSSIGILPVAAVQPGWRRKERVCGHRFVHLLKHRKALARHEVHKQRDYIAVSVALIPGRPGSLARLQGMGVAVDARCMAANAQDRRLRLGG